MYATQQPYQIEKTVPYQIIICIKNNEHQTECVITASHVCYNNVTIALSSKHSMSVRVHSISTVYSM